MAATTDTFPINVKVSIDAAKLERSLGFIDADELRKRVEAAMRTLEPYRYEKVIEEIVERTLIDAVLDSVVDEWWQEVNSGQG